MADQKRPTYHIGSMMAHKTRKQFDDDREIINLNVYDPVIDQILFDGDEFCLKTWMEPIDDWMTNDSRSESVEFPIVSRPTEFGLLDKNPNNPQF
jgi:hypothetical protein